jgi:hypothetical protein
MKTFTRIGLPILLVAGVVFGITFIRMYSPPEERQGSGDAKTEKDVGREAALKFFTVRAIVGNPSSTPKYLWYWDSTVEVAAPGHFEFWCQNRNPQPVTIRVPATNCQCAGAEMAVVPNDAYQEYAVLSALSGSPLWSAPAALAAYAHVNFESKLTWLPLFKGGERPDQTIPAANAASGPQFALVRLAWTGKGEPGPKGISAEVYASVGDAVPSREVLGAEMNVVPSFELHRLEGLQWASAREVSVGDLRENSEAKLTIYLASFTRSHLLYNVSSDHPTPCITWTEPVPATEEELASFIAHTRGTENLIRRVRNLSKIEFTVRERIEVATGDQKSFHQLDLGPVDRKLTIAGVGSGGWAMTLKGRVLGEIAVLSGADGGRIDLGTFAADQGANKEVVLLAERPGLDLSLLENETTPNYLKVKLEALKDYPDGRKQWKLRVTVPQRMLYGSLPENSGIVLKTSGISSRRLRLPVRGMTYDSGGPRL